MVKKSYGFLDPIIFLQTFISQIMNSMVMDNENNKSSHDVNIEAIGLAVSECFESSYRDEYNVVGTLDHEAYACMIVDIKNKIGGNFSRDSSDNANVLRVINTRCPFGKSVTHAPELCTMTSSVFGGIAARNFGYAKVILEKRIALGDRTCEVSIYTNIDEAASFDGDEYRRDKDAIHARLGKSRGEKIIRARDNRLWCDIVEQPSDAVNTPDLVAVSPAMRSILETIKVVAHTKASVLISGETGVGKEIVARRIHAMSQRGSMSFIPVNCGSIPESLIESILFGHERGAFTGAYEVHRGLFEQADGGTLFLDELDSLPFAAQSRLLRVLQDGEFDRVGGKHRLSADVRVIAAASTRLHELVNNGSFRRDLYYRINVVPINIPPLRERPQDITPLLSHVIMKITKKYGKPAVTLSDDVIRQALRYEWPGNVREMENILEHSFLFSQGETLTKIMLYQEKTHGACQPTEQVDIFPLKEARQRSAAQVESVIIREALARSHGNVTGAAKILGITPRAVHQKLKSNNIDPDEYRLKK
ncbi:MAG: sigma 54-interacting transcriptional regulator [Acidithiobacillus sp.]|jgi:DNA-binding NtrC family response regulator|uniref:sigma 54-interacting transcriptional regulator n=1 Tax=Acidithiobacillus sp. TaxID=1872118 RepID=UPI00355D7291